MEIRAAVLARAASGENDSSIARALGLPRATVRGMRRRAATVRPVCPRCWRRCREAVVPEDAYAEVLGLYLGDGCISRLARTFRLRLSLDSKYPELVAASRASIARVLPVNRVSTHREDGGNTTILTTHSGHLPCLFPQHGPGKKHHRLIALEGWQRDICLREPFALLRGLFRSDGCCFINRTGPYAYESYAFKNSSEDIIGICSWACEAAGLEHRRTLGQIRINRRASVAQMLEHVGRKA